MRPERGGAVAADLMAGGAAGRPSPWRTPTPYLFLGIGVMMGLIIVVMLVLICTRRTPRRREDKAASVRGVLVPLDREAPRVVVIMAGDDLPTFLASAKPLASAAAAGGDEAV